jgi:hypothetical protein
MNRTGRGQKEGPAFPQWKEPEVAKIALCPLKGRLSHTRTCLGGSVRVLIMDGHLNSPKVVGFVVWFFLFLYVL